MNGTTIGGADETLTRLSSGLTRWVLGLGLLSLHATVYTLSMVGMVLWNIYDAPDDLWVDEVFYRWTAVLAFHAIAVACGWTAWRLMRSEQAAVMAAQHTWTPVPSPASEYRPYEAHQPAGEWQQPAQLGPGTMQRYAASAHRAEDVAKRALSSSAAWSGAIARRTVGAMSGATSRLTHRGDAQAAPPATGNPTQGWPENPARLREDDQEFVARFTTPAEPTTTAQTPDHAATDTVLNVTSRSVPGPDATPHPMKEPGQTWVEAATSAWHGSVDATPDHRQNGHRDESITPGSTAE
jgi:hypothetical protein